MFLAVMLLFVVASCHKVSIQEPQASDADSLIFDIGVHKEYERMREVTDSLARGVLLPSGPVPDG